MHLFSRKDSSFVLTQIAIVFLLGLSKDKLEAQGSLLTEIPQSDIQSATWYPHSNTIVIIDNQSIIFLNTQMEQVEQIDIGNISLIAWSPDGTIVAVVRSRTTVELWDVTEWRLITEFSPEESPIKSIKWDRNGEQLAIVAVNSNNLYIWNTTTQHISLSLSIGLPPV